MTAMLGTCLIPPFGPRWLRRGGGRGTPVSAGVAATGAVAAGVVSFSLAARRKGEEGGLFALWARRSMVEISLRFALRWTKANVLSDNPPLAEFPGAFSEAEICGVDGASANTGHIGGARVYLQKCLGKFTLRICHSHQGMRGSKAATVPSGKCKHQSAAKRQRRRPTAAAAPAAAPAARCST